MAKRQTVWLSTMMILSLMVIGYYTVDDTLKPVPTNSAENSNNQQQAKGSNQNSNNSSDKKEAMTGADWFAEEWTRKEDEYSKKMEDLQAVIADSKTTMEQKTKAEQELKALQDFYQKAESAEDKVIAEGFEAALITKENNRVIVTVQAADLSKEQAAKIYSIVSKELSIPANQITLTYKQ